MCTKILDMQLNQCLRFIVNNALRIELTSAPTRLYLFYFGCEYILLVEEEDEAGQLEVDAVHDLTKQVQTLPHSLKKSR